MRGYNLLLAVVASTICTFSLTVAQHVRPHFVDYLDDKNLPPEYVAALLPNDNLALPIVTPPDQYHFAVNLGETHQFFVVGQWQDGTSPPAAQSYLGVLFEEPSSLWIGDPDCQATPITERDCAKVPGMPDWCACEALKVGLAKSSPNNRVFDVAAFASDNRRYGRYEFTAMRWRPWRELKVCFRVMDCNPNRGEGDPSACIKDAQGDYDLRFYPQRCVYVEVLQAPWVVAVHPLDATHAVNGTEQVAVPPQAWYAEAKVTDVKLQAGELLRLAVDAVDVNEDDDVDVRLAPGSARLPPGATLGPRLCCDAQFENCEERAVGSEECSATCAQDCSHITLSNNSVEAACVQACSTSCRRLPCRFVRRVVHYVGPRVNVQGVQFEAVDDSGRLDRYDQTTREGYPTPPACCNTSHLVSPPSLPVSITVANQLPTFAHPSLDHQAIVHVRVGCAMDAIGVYAVGGRLPVTWELVPDGCTPGTVVRSDVCVEEVCSHLTDCCCPTPPRICSLCLPAFPTGMEVTGPAPYSLLPDLSHNSSAPGSIESFSSPFSLLGAQVHARGGGAATAGGMMEYVVKALGSVGLPPHSLLIIRHLRPLNATTHPLTPR
eukprot:CAMPEP_0181296210 /NCGR_PEP_ID=MMETSP1101-20121128/4574_1 /TAXON_ID=46948 /ORGANISM="Rhodomonas abbreviata, Strain Caron Lab Isolate" /LENGTH=604 /DNA_ID=CAMNT_0023401043 /DNA_START=185 /DNA_END=1996 /DNA_ORIENTATION=+